jgi:oxygen-independent coproporphyrinogen-3 oxidase
MRRDLIRKYAAPVPRYTSYPTAPHFHPGVGETIYRRWLATLPQGEPLSLYVHIPFCDSLCWFCGCHTRHTLKYEPIERYLEGLIEEVETVGGLVAGTSPVVEMQWGGGSPTILAAADMVRLVGAVRARFHVAPSLAFGVEIDPRGFDHERVETLARLGLTRASIGVQDFDEKVQAAINRRQSQEETAAAVAALRQAGVSSINIDLVYGLPHQTRDSIARTAEAALALRPERVALFGYAHVPWMKKHQSMIAEETLAGPEERFAMANRVASLLTAAGYRRIGFDHFALPSDSLAVAAATGRLRRNFQGYADTPADTILGLGASAIGRLPDGYVQNTIATGDYLRRVHETGLATVRGIALDEDDRLRGFVIERLMCDGRLSRGELAHRFGEEAATVVGELAGLAATDADGLIRDDAEEFHLTARGAVFVRSLCARLDPYLRKGVARHSIAV